MKYFEEIRRLKSLQKAETYLDRRVTSGGGAGGGGGGGGGAPLLFFKI